MKGRTNKAGVGFFVLCAIIAVAGTVVAGINKDAAADREAAIIGRLSAVENDGVALRSKMGEAVVAAQTASAAARTAADEAARLNTVSPSPGIKLSSWATCYGIAPANGSFRLDCMAKE